MQPMFDDTTEGINQPVLICRNHQPVWHVVPRNPRALQLPSGNQMWQWEIPELAMEVFCWKEISHFYGGKFRCHGCLLDGIGTIFSSGSDGLSTSNPHKLGPHVSAKRCVEVGAFRRSMGIPGS